MIEVSIVIPSYNRQDSLRRCLRSLFEQDYPAERFEVIVVDDGSSYDAEKILGDLLKSEVALKVLLQKNKGPAAARNLGIHAAKGNIVCFVDDDCVVAPDWLRRMVQVHTENPHIAAVGGFTRTSCDKTPVLVGQFLANCSIETYLGNSRQVIFFPTCNVSFKKYIFAEHIFNELFPLPGGEDLELFWRLFKEGKRFIWDKDIVVIHYRDDNFTSFLRQAYIYGRGNLLTKYMYADQPLLKELKTGIFSFWWATFINLIKIPRFSCLLGKNLIKTEKITSFPKKMSVYAYFCLHKLAYLAGNCFEFVRIHKSHDAFNGAMTEIPRLLILDITHSCNLSCNICDIWKTNKDEENISIDYIKEALLQAKALGVPEIALSGGEPLLRKDIFDIFDFARAAGIKDLGVLSNGILVSGYLDSLKPYLLDNTISLVISLDSLNPQVHNSIRNNEGAWDKTRSVLDSLAQLKNEHLQLNFNVISIVLNQNLEELPELSNFIKSLGANSLQYQPLLPNNLKMSLRRDSAFWIPNQRLNVLDATIDKLIEFKKRNTSFVKNSTQNLCRIKQYYRGEFSEHVTCQSAAKTVLVSNQGNCTTCFSTYGDIKTQRLEEIFQSTKRRQAHRQAQKCSWPCLLPCFCDI